MTSKEQNIHCKAKIKYYNVYDFFLYPKSLSKTRYNESLDSYQRLVDRYGGMVNSYNRLVYRYS